MKLLAVYSRPDPRSILWRAIFSMLFGCGLRRSEVCSLRLADLFLEEECPFVNIQEQKNGQHSELPIPIWVMPALENYLAIRGPGEPSDYLFKTLVGPHRTKPKIEPHTVNVVFKEGCEAAGLPKGFSAHSARATAITKLLIQQYTHREVQEFSRHSSVRMVERYDKRHFGRYKNPGRFIRYDGEN